MNGDPNEESLSADDFAALMDRCRSVSSAKRIVVGVSGGADSMALTLLVDAWARARGIALTTLTVDHGLRDGSADEASRVGAWLRERGISHQTLRVSQARPVAGLQKAARNWRLAAFDTWCRDNEAGPILLAHTAEDQAETLWLRILADSGPDGLAAMRAETRVRGLPIVRPLLTVSKQRLIATCRSHGQNWIEDPSNRNPQFARVRLRDLAPRLNQHGLGASEAQRIIHGMSVTRTMLDRHCADFMREHGQILPIGVAWFEAGPFASRPVEFAELLLSRLTWALGGGALPPRRARVSRLFEALRSGAASITRTLGGCVISRRRDARVWIYRELAGCADQIPLRAGRKARWDNRFEAVWRGSDRVTLGPMREEGWRWIKQGDPNTSVARGLDALPHAVRLSIPVIRELDGTVSVPHFKAGDSVACAACDPPLAIGFCPDTEWIRSLITR